MIPQPSPEQVIAAYQSQVTLVRERVVAYAQAAWASTGTGLRTPDVDRLVAYLVPKVQAGQLRVAHLTTTYLSYLGQTQTGRAMVAAAVDSVSILNARGVPAAEVYRRPANTVYTELAGGASFADAKAAGLARLTSMVGMDLQMAKVRQSDASLRSGGFTYFRRTLTGAENCALCIIASTQRYRVGNLLPIHGRCDCGVAQIDSDFPFPRVIDPTLLESTHGKVAEMAGVADAGGRAPAYRKLTIVREHGEYGPTLTWRSDRFTGPADLAA